VANRSGVLPKWREFKRRGIIIAASPGRTENPDVSRMVICFETRDDQPATRRLVDCGGALAFVHQGGRLSGESSWTGVVS
jgi:hypothetical protein